MKKLLLLALTVTAATSLTACGGMGELEDFIEVLTGSNEEVARNYTLATDGYGYDNIVVDGDNVQYWNDGGSYYQLQTGEAAATAGYYLTWDCLQSATELEWDVDSNYSTYYAEYTVDTLLTYGGEVLTIEDFAKDGDLYFYTYGDTITEAANSSLTFEFTKDDDGNLVVNAVYNTYDYKFTNIGTSTVDLANLADTSADADTAA